MTPRTAFVVAACLAATTAGAAAAPAWGEGWVTPSVVGFGAEDSPYVAGSAGSAVAVWTIGTGVPDESTLASATKAPGAAPAVDAGVTPVPPVGEPSVASNATGTIAVAWASELPSGDAQITLRVYRDGAFVGQNVLPPETVGESAAEAAVAVAPDGRVLVGWVAGALPTTAQAIVRRPDGSLTEPFQLSTTLDASELQVAADGSGFITTFVRSNSDFTESSVEVVRVTPEGVRLPPQTLDSGTVDANDYGVTVSDPQIAVGGGRALVAYSHTDANEDDTEALTIRGKIGTVAGGVIGPPDVLSGPHVAAEQPAVAAGPDGTVAVTYNDAAGGGTSQLAVAAPGAGFALPQAVGGPAIRRDLGVLPNGSVLVGVAGTRLEGVLRKADGTIDPKGPADPGGVQGGSVAGDGAGHVVAAFHSAPLGGVSLTAYDAAGPQFGTLDVPDEGREGDRLTFTSSGPTDAWSGVTGTSWAFGDGDTASGERVTHTYDRVGRYEVTLTLRDSLGNESSRVAGSVGIRGRDGTPPPPPAPKPAPPTPPGQVDTIAPVLGKVVLSRSIFRVSSGATAIAAGRRSIRSGSEARFRTLEPGLVRVVIARMADVPSGRSACAAAGLPTRSKTRGPRRVKFERILGAGTHRIRLTGRAGRKALARGRYELRVSVADQSGNRSRAQVTRFTLC